MVVLVEHDRHGPVAGNLARELDQLGDAPGVADTVAVEEQVVGGAHDVFLREGVAGVGGRDEEAVTVGRRGLFHAVDEFVDPGGPEDFVIVAFRIGLVVHLDEDVAPAVFEHPRGAGVGGAEDGGLIGETLVLPEVKIAEDDDQAEVVGESDDAGHALEVGRERRAVGGERGVVPRLLGGVALGGAALEIDGEGEEAVRAPDGHGGEEFAGVALGVPFAGIRIGPTADRRGVRVVEHALHQAGVHEQALDFFILPGAAGVGGAPVDEKLVADDGDGGFRSGWGRGRGSARGGEDKQGEEETGFHRRDERRGEPAGRTGGRRGRIAINEPRATRCRRRAGRAATGRRCAGRRRLFRH